MIMFVDIEASSLFTGSWPIEIGLAWIGNDGEIVSEGHLIRPEASWSDALWSSESEAVHGIPRERLNDADPADDVARWTIRTVDDARLISDAPEFDQRWLDRLLETVPDALRLHVHDFDTLVWTNFHNGTPSVSAAVRAVYERRTQQWTLHRAAADAADLAAAWAAGLRVLLARRR